MKKTKLDIYLALQRHRRVGHTLFNVMGVNYDRPAIFIFMNNQHANEAMRDTLRYLENQGVKFPNNFVKLGTLELGPIKFRTLAYLSEEHYADLWGHPITIDHHALELIIEDDREERFKEWTKSTH